MNVALSSHDYLAITDHSKGLAIAHGMNEIQLARQGEEIGRLNAEGLGKGGFRILRAVEMNLSQAKRLAEDIAESVAGVREVRNELRVQQSQSHGSSTGSQGASDQTNKQQRQTR